MEALNKSAIWYGSMSSYSSHNLNTNIKLFKIKLQMHLLNHFCLKKQTTILP